MSFSQFIKDYIDTINGFYDSVSGDINLVSLLKFVFFYLSQSFKFLIQYFFSFRWFNDFYSFKITIPQLANSNAIDIYSTESPISHFFSFFESHGLIQNLFISGLLNSLFLSIPFSSSQILWLRRLTVEGIPAGIASGLGIIIGQFLLIICILLGFRFIIWPWYSFESLHYIFGVVLILSIVYSIAHKPIKRVKSSETIQLVKIFILHFILTWTEQSTLFQYFSNLSFNPEPTLFEVLNPENRIQSILYHWNYFFGLLFGTIFWTTFFGWVVLWIGYSLSKYLNFSYSAWIRNFNFSCLTLIIAFTLTSFPYYNLDYLITSPFGFISQDKALKSFQLRTNSLDLKKGRLGEYSSHTSLDTDVAPFDRGRYLTSSEVELTFEDLNYQGEYVWRSRNDRLASGSAGIVNKLISKFLPKLKKARADLKLKNNSEFSNDSFENSSLGPSDFEIYSAIYPFFSDTEDLIQRFLEDYQADVTNSNLPEPYQDLDQEPYSAFSELVRYGFDSFATFDDLESDEFEEKLGKKIKSKYYSNLVYKSILNFELSKFLERQPKKHSLKKEEENELFRKRLILANYYDSLREYSKTPYSESFQDLFLGPKSYANRVYNQQFKGTLKILRRLFSISLEPKENLKQESILKFDQPLYKEKINHQNPLLHEELKNKNNFLKKRTRDPFLKETEPIPFYAGWDNNLRKFLITNYWLTYSDSGVKANYLNIFEPPQTKKLYTKKKNKIIHFITWPLSKQKIEKLKYEPKQSVNFMFSSFDDPANEQQRDIFEYAESDDYDIRLIYETLPSILRRVDLRDKEKEQVYLQPLRGGIIWPGSEPIKLQLKQVLEIIGKIGRDWRDSNP